VTLGNGNDTVTGGSGAANATVTLGSGTDTVIPRNQPQQRDVLSMTTHIDSSPSTWR